MCLVIFAWLVAQDYFKEMTDNDIRKRIYEEQKNQIEQDMAHSVLYQMVWMTIHLLTLKEIDGILMNMVIALTCGTTDDFIFTF